MNLVRVIAVPVTAAALIGGLAGIQGDDDPTPEPPARATESPEPKARKSSKPAAPSEQEINDLAFVATVEGDTFWAARTDDELIAIGHATCDAFAEGTTLYDLVTIAQDTAVPIDSLGLLAGAATAAYCPEYSDIFGG